MIEIDLNLNLIFKLIIFRILRIFMYLIVIRLVGLWAYDNKLICN